MQGSKKAAAAVASTNWEKFLRAEQPPESMPNPLLRVTSTTLLGLPKRPPGLHQGERGRQRLTDRPQTSGGRMCIFQFGMKKLNSLLVGQVSARYRVVGHHPSMVQGALSLRRPGKLSETQQRTLVSCLRSKLMKTPDEMSGA